MIIRDVMTKNPICVTEATSVTEAKRIMTENKISKLPVLNSSKKLVGIITKNDIVKVSPSEATTLDMYEISSLLNKLTCQKFMTKKVVTVGEDEIVEQAARIMDDNNIGCLPVVKDDIVVGIVTESDLFELFVQMFGARESGVRANVVFEDKPGILAKVMSAFAEKNGNIISVVTRESKDAGKRRVTIKVDGVDLGTVKQILEASGGQIIDVRNV
ncbi:MAG: CBS and ACT domain-containing protein [Treponema sp.]|nr:CBS and ACT domain-containing protein [Treponema sp.]